MCSILFQGSILQVLIRVLHFVESGSEESFSDSQEEEDQHIWEEQQIGKGVSKHQVRPFNVILELCPRNDCTVHNLTITEP